MLKSVVFNNIYNVLKQDRKIKVLRILVMRIKKDKSGSVILSLARPCHHCTHTIINMEKNLRLQVGNTIDIKVRFSRNSSFSNWIRPTNLWNWNNTSPIITFGKMSSVFSNIHSWLTIKPIYVNKILTGEKRVEHRPPKPNRGSWLKSPFPNKKVLIGVVEGTNKKLKINSRIVSILIVSCIAKDASYIVIHKVIKVAPYYCKGFPGFIPNNMITKYL